MNYLVRTEEIEYHVINADNKEDVLPILAKHLTMLWGDEECRRLMPTAEITITWDNEPGYKATIYKIDEEEREEIREANENYYKKL